MIFLDRDGIKREVTHLREGRFLYTLSDRGTADHTREFPSISAARRYVRTELPPRASVRSRGQVRLRGSR